MRIDNLQIKNFKGYKDFDVKFNRQLNLIIGKNGSGKTAILEALVVAAGTFFLGIKNYSTRGIRNSEIHISSNRFGEEYQLPVQIRAEGTLLNEHIIWSRELNGVKNKTTSGNASNMKSVSNSIDRSIRNGEDIKLPVIAYYSTSRLFDEARKNKNESGKGVASRLRAYNHSLNSKSTFRQFERWFKGKEIAAIQKKGGIDYLDLVRNTIIYFIPPCENFYYEFDEDLITGLKILMEDGRILPFDTLSDGLRNYIALIADLVYKCIVLNPHLGSDALNETEGVVMIDELDLHLHPDWQKNIIRSLIHAFPKMQFFITTHSPFLIQEAGENQLIILDDGDYKSGSALNMSIEDIAEELQDVKNPQWSKQRELMFEQARKYYSAKKNGEDTYEMKQKLVESMKPFARDTALYSVLEQEEIIKKYNK